MKNTIMRNDLYSDKELQSAILIHQKTALFIREVEFIEACIIFDCKNVRKAGKIGRKIRPKLEAVVHLFQEKYLNTEKYGSLSCEDFRIEIDRIISNEVGRKAKIF